MPANLFGDPWEDEAERVTAKIKDGVINQRAIISVFLSPLNQFSDQFNPLASAIAGLLSSERPWLSDLLTWTLKHGDVDTRLKSLRVLRDSRRLPRELIAPLIETLDSDDYEDSLLAATALTNADPPALEAAPVLFRKHKERRANFPHTTGLMTLHASALLDLIGVRSTPKDQNNLIQIALEECNTYPDFIHCIRDLKPLTQPAPQPQQEPSDRPRFLEVLLAAVPVDAAYSEQAQKLEELSHGFRQQVASRLQMSLKSHIQAMPHGTHSEKKDLVRWVNAELRRFDLAIKHPKTGTAANLVADKGNHPEEGRFQLRAAGEDGKAETFSTPKIESLLNVLELMEAPRREEGLANWADRSKRSDTRQQR